jgi:hypothetical protein
VDDRRLILILSSERSGSTLTRVVLGAHNGIVAPQEMFLLRYPDYATFKAQKAVALESVILRPRRPPQGRRRHRRRLQGSLDPRRLPVAVLVSSRRAFPARQDTGLRQ